MRKAYLIRHGKPDFPNGARMCLGRTELPLGAGWAYAGPRFWAGSWAARWTRCTQARSRASRADGPQALGRPVTVIDGLAASSTPGEWDGLTFDEIRARYPELYARRATERYLPLPGSEPDGEALRRFTRALCEALSGGGTGGGRGPCERDTPVPGQPRRGHGQDTIRLLRGAQRRRAGADRRPCLTRSPDDALCPEAAARGGDAGARHTPLRRRREPGVGAGLRAGHGR